MAPPAEFVPEHIHNLFAWYQKSKLHPLIKSAVFHYAFEFIHPSADGNGQGRMLEIIRDSLTEIMVVGPSTDQDSDQVTDQDKTPTARCTSNGHLSGIKEMSVLKSSVRCKVEHAFLIVKKQMGYAKAAYRGIEKNMNRFHVLFASANLLMCSRADRTQDFAGGMV